MFLWVEYYYDILKGKLLTAQIVSIFLYHIFHLSHSILFYPNLTLEYFWLCPWVDSCFICRFSDISLSV